MSLNDQYSKPVPNNLRLSKLSSIPSAEDLAFAMTLATNNPRNIVELPWKVANSEQQYTIKVTCALSLEEPRWMLYVGAGTEEDGVIWNYDTPDYQLVFNLISEECEKPSYGGGGGNIQDGYNNQAAGGNQQYSQNNQQAYMQPGAGMPGGQGQQAMQPQYGNQMQQGMQHGMQMQPNPMTQQNAQHLQMQQGQAMQQQTGQHTGQQQAQDSPYGAPPFQPSRGTQSTINQPTMPVTALPTATGNSLPAMAFGAAAASIAQPPPLVPPGSVAGREIVAPTAAPPYVQPNEIQAQSNPYGHQAQPNPPLPYIEEPFGQQHQNQQHQQGTGQYAQAGFQSASPFQQLGQQVSQGGLRPAQDPAIQQYGQEPQMQTGSHGQYQAQANYQMQGQTQGHQQGQPYPQEINSGDQQRQSTTGAYMSPGVPDVPGVQVAKPPELPSSRMFTLPQPGAVRNPAERLVDNAVGVEESPPAKTPHALPPPVKFDRTAVDSVFKMLTAPELGFLNHGALMFFTVREFSRFQRSNVPFSIVLFELVIASGNGWEPMPQNLVKDVGKQLFGVMRPLDLIAHYENSDYAMLLPHTSREDSFTVVQRLHEMLNSTSVAPGLAAGQAQIFCGIATIPDDCAHPGVAIAAALEAKAEAKLAGRPVLRFCDI